MSRLGHYRVIGLTRLAWPMLIYSTHYGDSLPYPYQTRLTPYFRGGRMIHPARQNQTRDSNYEQSCGRERKHWHKLNPCGQSPCVAPIGLL